MYIIVYLRHSDLDTLEHMVNDYILNLQRTRGTIYIERSELIFNGIEYIHHLTIRTS
jgi:hypothetical protein